MSHVLNEKEWEKNRNKNERKGKKSIEVTGLHKALYGESSNNSVFDVL